MTSESLKLYKLIILYFLSQTRQPISNAILSDFILKNNYADYFSIQETLSALTDDRMIFLEKTYSKAFYTIAPKGLETLDFFGHLLPDDTKFQIDQYLVENKITIVEDTTINTDFKQLGPKQYRIHRLEFGEVSGHRVLIKRGPGNRGPTECGTTHEATSGMSS